MGVLPTFCICTTCIQGLQKPENGGYQIPLGTGAKQLGAVL